MASGGKRGAGERVLEGRHVIGLFMLMLVFSGVFFTLGYVMGRNQYDGQASASTLGHNAFDAVLPKPNAAKHADKLSPPPPKPAETAAPPNSDWEFYNAGKPKAAGEDRLKPADSVATHKATPAIAKNDAPPSPLAASSKSVSSRSSGAPHSLSGGITLQVAALTKEADALDLASRLQKQKFPAVVLSPQADKFYRVQVGPYPDQKSADAAKKGLEAVGFKAFVKR